MKSLKKTPKLHNAQEKRPNLQLHGRYSVVYTYTTVRLQKASFPRAPRCAVRYIAWRKIVLAATIADSAELAGTRHATQRAAQRMWKRRFTLLLLPKG